MPIHNALLLIWILLFLGYGFINPVSDLFLVKPMFLLLSLVIGVAEWYLEKTIVSDLLAS
jgi:hypothetical protein